MRQDIGEKGTRAFGDVGHDHVIERQPDGKMRVASGSWDGEKVFLKDQVLKVRHAIADARLRVARKTKRYDDWTRPMSPYGPGALGHEAIDD